ncbi:MAG TPA: GNAT family N-acetyltransferase [Ignavibacteria bacterium]|nr:GNAT family N-acetyltransferase [Ignavibacteria bacterium]
MKIAKTIKGKNCSLKLFEKDDKNLLECINKVFHDENITGLLNPAYPLQSNKRKVSAWIRKCVENPVEYWYAILSGRTYIGYVCFKWKKHYDKACEVSTAMLSEFRGLKLGFESSKILVDYIGTLGKFDYAVAFSSKNNKKAQNNLRKIGFRKSKRLFKVIEKEFYNENEPNPHDSKYILLAYNFNR